jgi:dipeptidyl aminopeptidase/acylaminoacyl peptidase
LLAALLAVAGWTSSAQAAKPGAPPPLLDRELFFGNPEISGAQISPDGQYLAFIKPLDDVRNIWIKGADEPFEAARPLTADDKPIPGYFWSRGSDLVLYVQDKDGDENFNIYAVDPAADPAEGQQVPEARDLTELEGVRVQIYAVPRTMRDTIYIGLNDRDPAWHDLYRLQLSTGERTLIRENTEKIAAWYFDNAGRLRLASRITDDGSTEILVVTEDGFEEVYSCTVFESCGPIRFHKDAKRVYMTSNKGDDVDLSRLVLFDPTTGKQELVEDDPRGRVDFGGAVFSDLTDELLATVYRDDRTRVYFRDKSLKKDYKLLKKKLGDMEIGFGSHTEDERYWLISATSDVEPGERYLFDRKTKAVTFQYQVFEDLPREYLAPMQPVRYASSDGLEIPAYLTLPLGVKHEKLPAILVPHGGPWYRDSWGYDPIAQFLANRGYAVLQPNFRASTGYGKAFLNAGNKEWGLKMQDDLTWGVKYLVDQGIADPKRVGIMGGSYGGYATLAGLAFTPDVYAAGVSIVGPSNLLTLLDSIPPYWASISKIFNARMGDRSTPEGQELLERASPLNSADKIERPLLVVQGANDPRVKKAESDQIVVALRERKFPVEYIVAPDEGHGFRQPINNMAMFARAEEFLSKHLGGRYQSEMPEEVRARLDEISVDVATVKLPEKIDEGQMKAPAPVAGLRTGTYKYDAKIEVAGQAMQMSIEREIRETAEGWTVTERFQGPMGGGEDRTVLAKGTLALVSREVEQGPAKVQVEIAEGRASGKLDLNGQENPIDVELGGQLFADGAGANEALASLPLAEGYSLVYRTLDLMRQREKLMKLEVQGVERVTVPAGTFDTWRLEIVPANGDPGSASVWVARDSRKVVKSSAVLPEMNGAVITAELVP